MLLWLWRRPAAVAPIQPLAWESPQAAGVALQREKKKEEEITWKRSSFKNRTITENGCHKQTKKNLENVNIMKSQIINYVFTFIFINKPMLRETDF